MVHDSRRRSHRARSARSPATRTGSPASTRRNWKSSCVGRIEPASTEADDVLLEVRRTTCSSAASNSARASLLVAANGSFLLNAMLVNHEHRKLAGKLIEQHRMRRKRQWSSWRAGPAGRRSAKDDHDRRRFNRRGDLPPLADELDPLAPGGGRASCSVLRVGRFSAGRAGADEPPPSDFGKHIDALAELMSVSRDRAYAIRALLHYQQNAKEEKKKLAVKGRAARAKAKSPSLGRGPE